MSSSSLLSPTPLLLFNKIYEEALPLSAADRRDHSIELLKNSYVAALQRVTLRDSVPTVSLRHKVEPANHASLPLPISRKQNILFQLHLLVST